MFDYLEDKKAFYNSFVQYTIELNILFNNVYIEKDDQSILKFIELGYYKNNNGFRMANLFFFVEGKKIKVMQMYEQERFLLVDLDNNWPDLQAFSEKICWFINSLEHLLKII